MTRILVINDTQELLEMFRTLLEQEGYDVVISGTPIFKIKDIGQMHPDLIILDITFGDEKSGWQMVQMLKMQRSTSRIPIVVGTASLHEIQEQEGFLVAQGIRVIYKPFDIDSLISTISHALAAYQKASKDQDACYKTHI